MKYAQIQLKESASALVVKTTPHREGLRFALGVLLVGVLCVVILGALFFPTNTLLKCSRTDSACQLSQTSVFVLKTEEQIALQDIRDVTIDSFRLKNTPRYDVSFQLAGSTFQVATFGSQTQAEALQRDLQHFLKQTDQAHFEYLKRDILYWQIAGVFLGLLVLIFLVMRVILYKGHWHFDKQTKQLSGNLGFRRAQTDFINITRVYLKPLRAQNFGETTFELRLSVSGSRPLTLALGLGREEARQIAEKLRILLGLESETEAIR